MRTPRRARTGADCGSAFSVNASIVTITIVATVKKVSTGFPSQELD
jgi:hypothetical protein